MAAFLAVVVAGLVAVVPLPHASASGDRIGAHRGRTRKLQQAGLEACNVSRQYELGFTESKRSCSPCEVDSMGFAALECSDGCSSCDTYFDGSTTICYRVVFESERYDPAGNLTFYVYEEEYTRAEGYGAPSLGTKYREEDAYDAGAGLVVACASFLNDEKCTSCELRKCNETDSSYVVDCSNVLTGSYANYCTETYTGFFENWLWESEFDYYSCDSPPQTTTAATAETAATTVAADSGTSPTTAAADSGTSPAAADDPSSCASTIVKMLQILPYAAISIVVSGLYM